VKDDFKHEFVASTARVRVEVDDLLRTATEAELRQPNAEGDWSCADILAHLSGYTRGVADALREARGLGPVAPPYGAAPGLSDDDFNAIVVSYWRSRTVEALLGEERSAYGALVSEVLRVPTAAIETPGRFAFCKRASLQAILPQQIHQHYADHMPALRRSLSRR